MEEIPVTDSRSLHSLQVAARNLKYEKVAEIAGCQVFKTKAVEFPLEPDARFLRQLHRLKPTDGKVARLVKLLAVAGSNRHLLALIFRGIGTGLSHGTMDVIYRLNTGEKSRQVLDNLDIAVGALQRRVIIADIVARQLQCLEAEMVISLAGGTCLLVIEGSCQSGCSNITIISLDQSQTAHAKAAKILAQAPPDTNLQLRSVACDVLSSEWNLPVDEGSPRVIECTGFWEYLTDAQRTRLLEKLAAEIAAQDVLILTGLTHNPQQALFEAMKFKRLRPHSLEAMLLEVERHFEVQRAILTGNETYVTLELTQKA